MGTAIIFLLVGLFTTICTLVKPSFYWESRRAQRLRRLVGDGITTIFYLALGIFFIGLGIVKLLRISPL